MCILQIIAIICLPHYVFQLFCREYANNIEYNLKATSVSPLAGSLYGGTFVTILGEGFSTDTNNVVVKFDDIPCQIKTVEDSKIVCETGTTANLFVNDNYGTHPGMLQISQYNYGTHLGMLQFSQYNYGTHSGMLQFSQYNYGTHLGMLQFSQYNYDTHPGMLKFAHYILTLFIESVSNTSRFCISFLLYCTKRTLPDLYQCISTPNN